MINSIQNVSFKGYVPVKYYAKNPANGEYVQVIKKENIRKCNSFVVRNLNGTAKNMKNDDFVNFYSAYDRDYRKDSVVHSVYDKDSPIVYLVTGADAAEVKELAKPVGIAKGKSIDMLGHSKSFESANAANDYFRNVKYYLKNSCSRLKNRYGEDLSLRVYFNPKYDKKNNLKGFDFVNARFTKVTPDKK